jgi:hypothetical protein
VSDVEHELVTENRELRERVALLADVSRRSVVAAMHAQDAALGHHDAWLDEALTAIALDDVGQLT